jgi:hypothetical protein
MQQLMILLLFDQLIITTATTGQKTIGSETQSDLLMMGVKTPKTC